MSNGGTKLSTVVIGGGATGCGVARDLILRGFKVTLVELGDLGSGTSSRFHGMLQSGARYAVSDTEYAAECMRERLHIAKLAPQAVEKYGGLFVSLPGDPPGFADQFVAGCQKAQIPVEELNPDQVMTAEPEISRQVLRAFSVPDATVQSWRLVNLLADDVRKRGGEILTRNKVISIDVTGGKTRGVMVESKNGKQYIPADIIVNAAGPWSGQVADLVGEKIDLELGKGSILVFSHRIVSKAINRCRPPTSHDIIVPAGTISLFGTTSEIVDDPSTTRVRPEEIQELLDNAELLLPNARHYRAFRAWAGVRPLYKPDNWSSDKPLPRRHSIINHNDNGIEGFFTICGGSLTTHRSMAEDIGNRICTTIGIDAPCTSATTPLSSQQKSAWRPAENFHQIEKDKQFSAPICECESVTRDDIVHEIEQCGIRCLHDLRRRLRVGFGPCQGTFCAARVAAIIAQYDSDYSATEDLEKFWAERLKGSRHTAWGQQARQILLSDVVFQETFGLRPGEETVVPRDCDAK
ncbi:MAG: glycerol-3-phosphate dehydrogenase [Parasphingorhabdus sp.]|jgi:glycerol-3-phosphate dehydrogenase